MTKEDYIGEDGLLHCGICGEAKQAYLPQNNQVEKSKTKVKYCSKCGSKIDHITKKCTG